ncbi:TRAP transporter small permease subunit [Sulfitobacter sp. S190]|uniref:TRAP transporter small permease subunit n=1 Tax=Sulfitobacter sp. S190 TaxID=2867022 RepID=UPI0021A56EBB|nr:TRAP transporter small permease [Sulfitobacter sp. S190]UWR21728.1 TRAP transporter small permease [Sulfitobacter sp. S190]
MLDRILNGTRKASLWLTWLGGTLIVLSAFLVTLEVLLRKLFNVSLGGADEISGYAFGVATTLGFSYALFERAHIRVDALLGVIPAVLRPIINFLGLVLLIGFALVVVVMVWGMVGDTLDNGSRSITPMRVPLAIPQVPWLIGWMFFVFSGVLIGAVAIRQFLRGDVQGVQELIGVKSLDEQIQDETV